MQQTPLRVVLDSNVFSKQHFDAIEGSRMLELCRRGRVKVIYCSRMLDETIKAYLIENRREEFQTRWFPFMDQTADRFGLPLKVILRRELSQGRGRKTNIFASTAEHQRLRAKVMSMEPGGSSPHMAAAQPIWDASRERMDKRRNAMKALRAEAASPSGTEGVISQAVRALTSGSFVEALHRHAEATIEGMHPCDGWRSVYARWARDTAAYPFFSQVMVNGWYEEMLAIGDHSSALDKNAPADLEILTYLLHADVIVSNEDRFMRRAFSDLWKPLGKVMMNSQQFAAHLDRF